MATIRQNQQSILILAMIVLLGFILGYFYYSSYVVPAVIPVQPPPIAEKDDLEIFENLEIDFAILTNERFQTLQIFGESPVNPGATGKKNLFSSF